MKEKIREFLRESNFLSKDEINYSINLFNERKLRIGDFFIEENKNCNIIGFIENGATKAFATDSNGNQNITCFKFENQFITSFSDFNLKQKSKISIQAIEESEICYIDNSNFNFLINKIPAWNMIIQFIVAQDFLDKEKYILNYSNKTALEKYQLLINESPELIKRIKGIDLASYLGVNQRTLTRIRREITLNV